MHVYLYRAFQRSWGRRLLNFTWNSLIQKLKLYKTQQSTWQTILEINSKSKERETFLSSRTFIFSWKLIHLIKDQTNSEWVIPLRTQVYECIRPNNSQQYPPKTIPYYITAHSSNAPNFSAGKWEMMRSLIYISSYIRSHQSNCCSSTH